VSTSNHPETSPNGQLFSGRVPIPNGIRRLYRQPRNALAHLLTVLVIGVVVTCATNNSSKRIRILVDLRI
jgi:hypothetical protein